MDKPFIAKASTLVNTSASSLWEILTSPEKIAQYMFGT